MTDGGPNNATLTVMLLIYRYAFKYYDMGIAAAMGLTLFIILLVFTIFYFRITKKLGLDKTAA
jgi:multiple sugar transport system permease protein